MHIRRLIPNFVILIGTAIMLAGCGEPRAVMLPLEYPDGSPVTTRNGEPLMAGYQTYGSAVHANATALYESAKPPTCATCAHVGMVVTEPSVLRQATGVLDTATIGAGAVMTGVGIMDNPPPSTNVVQNTNFPAQQQPQQPHRRSREPDGDYDDGGGQRSQPQNWHPPYGSPYARSGWGQEQTAGYYGNAYSGNQW